MCATTMLSMRGAAFSLSQITSKNGAALSFKNYNLGACDMIKTNWMREG